MLRSSCQIFVSIYLCLIIGFTVKVVKAQRISQEKCEKFAELVYEEEISPVLRMGIERKRTSKCAIAGTPLIVGGELAKPREFPHMVEIGYGKNTRNVTWQCGGTLISENYVLTAAHCLETSEDGPPIVTRAGMTNLIEPEKSMQERTIAEKIKHPSYKSYSKYHDIALLKLQNPFNLNSDVRPLCLEVENRSFSDVNITASGFGKTAYENSKGSPRLMKVQLNDIPSNECEKAFKPIVGRRQLSKGLIPSLICAGIMEGGKDTCQGDSGGPLQRTLKNPYCMYSIIGVTSFGKFCAFKNSPAIYTRVSSYLDWIESIVWREEYEKRS